MSDLIFDIGRDLQRAYDEGYEKGKADAEQKDVSSTNAGELISRQAAITEMCRRGVEAEKEGIMDMTMVDAKHFFVEAIESLPAVNSSTDLTTTDGGSTTDCISREAVLDLFAEKCDTVRPYHEVWQAVKELPSVEPERKPGKWIRAIDPDVNAWTGGHTCSECGRACVQMSMNYCANCGAPMEVDDTINLKIGDFSHEKSDNNR